MKISDDGCPQVDTSKITDMRVREFADYINEKLRAWFESQPVVYGEKDDGWYGFNSNKDETVDTHRARLCGIMPIKNDTAEDVLRDFLTYRGTLDGNEFEKTRDLAVRARKVLERGE